MSTLTGLIALSQKHKAPSLLTCPTRRLERDGIVLDRTKQSMKDVPSPLLGRGRQDHRDDHLMQQALDQFRSNIQHVRNLHNLYVYFSTATTAVLDLSDLLRAQIVLTVQRPDHYVHELTRLGMIEIFELKRPTTSAFLRFQVSLDGAINGIQLPASSGWLEGEIRTKHGYASFQQPDRIADAIRLISSVELWNEVSIRLRHSGSRYKEPPTVDR